MEPTSWTDERLDEKMKAIGATFDELRAGRIELRQEMAEMRAEMRAGFSELREQIAGLQRQLNRIVAGFALALLGIVGAALTAALIG